MFPGAGAHVYYNEAGEPIGWDYPSYEPEYCPDCGGPLHADECPYYGDEDDDDE